MATVSDFFQIRLVETTSYFELKFSSKLTKYGSFGGISFL